MVVPSRPTGLLPKHALLQYIQSGGSTSSGPDSTSAAAKRRNETLYRVYSIEQYTLASALAELSAAALTPGMRASGASLRQLAAAHHEQEEAAAAALASSSAGDAGSEGLDGPGSGGVSGSSSVQQLDLPMQAADGRGPAPAGSPAGSQPSFTLSQKQHLKQEPVPQQAMLVDAAPLPEAGGPLAWLGLASATPLRATPGTASQFRLLLLRSGAACHGAGRGQDSGMWALPGNAQTGMRATRPRPALRLPRQRKSWVPAAGAGGQASLHGQSWRFSSPPCPAGIKWTRNWSGKMLEVLLLVLAGVVLGEQGPNARGRGHALDGAGSCGHP